MPIQLPQIISTFKSVGLSLMLVFILNLAVYSTFASHNHQLDLSEQQKTFIAAEQALKKDDWKNFRALVSKLENYPLKPYLRRDYLLARWALQPDNRNLQSNIALFIEANSNDVVSRKIRSKWLNYLADHNKSEMFLNYYQAGFGKKFDCKNAEFQLIRFRNLSKTQGNENKKNEGLSSDLLNLIESNWMVGKPLPKSCDGMIKEWKYFTYPNQSHLEKRVLLSIDNKQVRLTRYLIKQIQSLNPNYVPSKVLSSRDPLAQFEKSQPNDKLSQQIIFNALTKLAWSEPLNAINYWEKYSEQLHFDKINSNKLKRAIALSLAIEGEATAKNWLDSLDANTDLSVNQWLLSVAIDENDWNLIEHLARLKNRHSLEPDKWRYWRAIAVNRKGHIKAADKLFKGLAKHRNYYGFLAAMEVNQQAQLNKKDNKFTQKDYLRLIQKPETKRAYELFKLNRLRLARSEWNNLKAQSDRSDLVILAQIAYDWGWNHQSILAFAKSKQIDDIERRFPLYKLNKYELETTQHNIPLSWAYAITRQESAFKIDAISSAGAKGLMQLTHNTAKRVYNRNKQLSQHSYSHSNQLLEANTNIELGIAHLSELLKLYEGHPILATAAYNAGSHKVEQWLKANTVSDPVLWIEQIPYKETREYVKNVLTYEEIYSQLTGENNSFITKLDQYNIPTTNKNNVDLSAH